MFLELLEKYKLTKSKFDYEFKRSQKYNIKIEDWLEIRFKKGQKVFNQNYYNNKTLVENLIETYDTNINLNDQQSKKNLLNFILHHKHYKETTIKENNLSDDDWDNRLHNIFDLELRTFLRIHHKIKSIELFWIIFGWMLPSLNIIYNISKELEIIFNTNNRLGVGLEYRTKLVNFIRDNLEGLDIVENSKDTENLFNKYCKLNKNSDFIKIYRGFLLNKNDGNIRDFLNKKKQNVGTGLYYTFNKDYAIFFIGWFSSYSSLLQLIYDYSKIPSEIILKSFSPISKAVLDLKIDTQRFSDDISYRKKIINNEIVQNYLNYTTDKRKKSSDAEYRKYNKDLRSLVGTYQVKKENIICILNSYKHTRGFGCYEESLICLQKNVEFIRYDYLKHSDYENWRKLNVSLGDKEHLNTIRLLNETV